MFSRNPIWSPVSEFLVLLLSLFSYPGVIFISWLYGFLPLFFCLPWRLLADTAPAVFCSFCHLCPCRVWLFLQVPFALFCTLAPQSGPLTSPLTLFTSLWLQFLLFIFAFSSGASLSAYHRIFCHFLSPLEIKKGWLLSSLAIYF